MLDTLSAENYRDEHSEIKCERLGNEYPSYECFMEHYAIT